MSHSPGKRAVSTSRPSFLRGLLFAATALFAAGTASAAVDLRVDATTNPVSVYATVTDSNGAPITGLGAGAFAMTVDGATVSPAFSTVNGVVSVVFAMDYSGSVTNQKLVAMQNAVKAFIAAMQPGEKAAIVKFNASNPNHASLVQAFTTIDGTNTALNAAVESAYDDPGTGTNIFDALVLSVQQFTGASGASLPSGPKAVILVSDGVDNASTADINDVIGAAEPLGIPIFTVDIGGFPTGPGVTVMKNIATQTHGAYYSAPTNPEIASAYQQLDARLNNEYLLTFSSAISGCADHTVLLTVTGQTPEDQDFTRCVAVFAPELVGLTPAAAQTEVTAWNATYGSPSGYALALGVPTHVYSLTVAAGLVATQTPDVGAQVTASATVNIAISDGPAPATVPSVVGLTQAAATTALAGVNLLVVTPVTTQSSTTVVAGLVISQNPAAGAAGVHEGDSVTLVVSSGPPPVTVANVVGNTQAAATSTLTGQGLTVGTVTQQSSASVASGSVISQSPVAGTSVASGSAVNLVVSSGPAAAASGGGGGATGPVEILFGLGLVALALGRRPAVRRS